MQTTKVTVELEICHRDDIGPGEVTEDLRRILNSDAGCRLLQEQAPHRHVTGGGWWANAATITTPGVTGVRNVPFNP